MLERAQSVVQLPAAAPQHAQSAAAAGLEPSPVSASVQNDVDVDVAEFLTDSSKFIFAGRIDRDVASMMTWGALAAMVANPAEPVQALHSLFTGTLTAKQLNIVTSQIHAAMDAHARAKGARS